MPSILYKNHETNKNNKKSESEVIFVCLFFGCELDFSALLIFSQPNKHGNLQDDNF